MLQEVAHERKTAGSRKIVEDRLGFRQIDTTVLPDFIMHILVALLTAAAGLAWVLYRLQHFGVNLNSFNPFYWLRRHSWQKQPGAIPAHRLKDPVEAAALLVVAMAALEDDPNCERKAELIELFMREFQIPREAAVELYAASAHLLKDVNSITPEVKLVLAPSKSRYKVDRTASLLRMMRQAATAEGPATPAQLALLDAVSEELHDAQPYKRD